MPLSPPEPEPEVRVAAVPRAAVLPHRAAERVGRLVVAAERGARAVLERTRVQVDHGRVDRAHLLVLDAESLGRAGAHVVGDDVGRLDQPPQRVGRGRVLDVEGQVALALVDAHAHVVERPGRVIAGRVDRDHVGTEVGEQLRRPRSRDREPEVEHAHACERATVEIRGAASAPTIRRCERRDRGRAASARTSSVCCPRAGAGPARRGRVLGELVQHARDAERAELGVVDLGHRAVGEVQRIGQRLFGGAYRVHAHVHALGELGPVVARELGEVRDRVLLHAQLVGPRAVHRAALRRDRRRDLVLVGLRELVAGGRERGPRRVPAPVTDPPVLRGPDAPDLAAVDGLHVVARARRSSRPAARCWRCRAARPGAARCRPAARRPVRSRRAARTRCRSTRCATRRRSAPGWPGRSGPRAPIPSRATRARRRRRRSRRRTPGASGPPYQPRSSHWNPVRAATSASNAGRCSSRVPRP